MNTGPLVKMGDELFDYIKALLLYQGSAAERKQ